MKFILSLCAAGFILTSISAGDEIPLPNSVKQFRDDSTYYERIEGVKVLKTKPTSENLDSLAHAMESYNFYYVRDLLYGYVAELAGKLDSATFYYKGSLRRKLRSGQNYYANLDLARMALKSQKQLSAEKYLEAYLDTLYFNIMTCDLFWGSGTPDIIIIFLDDHSLKMDNIGQDECSYFIKEYPHLKNILIELKEYNNTFQIIPGENQLEESLEQDGARIADFIINTNIPGLLKYVDNEKWKVACVGRNTLSAEELEFQLSDTLSVTYCYLFGGASWGGKSLRGYLIDAKNSNFRIKTEIFDDDFLLSPIGILTYEWDVDPDFQDKMSFPFAYFLYGRNGWIIMSLFAEW